MIVILDPALCMAGHANRAPLSQQLTVYCRRKPLSASIVVLDPALCLAGQADRAPLYQQLTE